jgi:hypothetical protein
MRDESVRSRRIAEAEERRLELLRGVIGDAYFP